MDIIAFVKLLTDLLKAITGFVGQIAQLARLIKKGEKKK